MNQIHQLLSKGNYKTVGKFHIIHLCVTGSHVSRMKLALVNKIF